MNRRDRDRSSRRLKPPGDTRLAKFAAVLLTVGVIITVIELILTGRASSPVLALDIIAGTLVPFGVISMFITFQQRGGDPPPEDEGNGGGGGGTGGGWRPLSPTGGLKVDWQRFEDDFHAYAQRQREGTPSA